jgi:hypothetical protein
LLWTNVLLLMELLSGCTLAQPQFAGTAGGDTFCGFWLVYDRWENEDSHVFDLSSDTEQMLLEYMMPGDGNAEPAYTSKTGSSVGDAAMSLNYKDEGVEVDIKGTLYLLGNEDQSLQDQGYREVWLYNDVVQSFRDFYVQPPEGASQEDLLKPGETIILYIPQEQIDLHGQELKKIAEGVGAHLILKNESPRQLKIISVYQRPDGTVYADEGGTHFLMSSAGMSTTQTVENTQTVGGKTTKKKVTATVSVQWIDKLKTVRLLEMNDQNVLVRMYEATEENIQAWAKREKPFAAGKDTAYLVVEETYETKQGGSYVKRTVYDRPQSNDLNKPLHIFHFPKENGLTEAAYMSIDF